MTDLSPLAGLCRLRVLELGDTAVTDLSPLCSLTALRRLDIRGTQTTNDAAELTHPDCEIVSAATFRRARRGAALP